MPPKQSDAIQPISGQQGDTGDKERKFANTAKQKNFDGSRPPTGKSTGIDGRPPDAVRIQHALESQERTLEERREAYLQEIIQYQTLQVIDVEPKDLIKNLAKNLLELRNIPDNELTNQTLIDLNIHREDIAKALSNYIKKQTANLDFNRIRPLMDLVSDANERTQRMTQYLVALRRGNELIEGSTKRQIGRFRRNSTLKQMIESVRELRKIDDYFTRLSDAHAKRIPEDPVREQNSTSDSQDSGTTPKIARRHSS